MRQAEQERMELQEARMRAEEAQRHAEEAAHLEKEERDRKVCIVRPKSIAPVPCSNSITS